MLYFIILDNYIYITFPKIKRSTFGSRPIVFDPLIYGIINIKNKVAYNIESLVILGRYKIFNLFQLLGIN